MVGTGYLRSVCSRLVFAEVGQHHPLRMESIEQSSQAEAVDQSHLTEAPDSPDRDLQDPWLLAFETVML